MERASTEKNLRIWSQVDTTDPDFTKHYKGKGGFEGSALNTMYLIKKATQIWGPMGKGWGFRVTEEYFSQGAPIKKLEGTDTIIYGAIHTCKLQLWYIEDGERCEVENYGHTDFVYADKFGVKTESEPAKKSVTDALKKCLSGLGFSADVFMGLFDDKDYVEVVQNKALIEKADNQAEEIARQAAEHRALLEKMARNLATAVSAHELKTLRAKYLRQLDIRGDKKSVLRIEQIAAQRAGELADKQIPEAPNDQPVSDS